MREYSLDFVFDMNDFGLIDAEVLVSVMDLDGGKLSIETVDVIINSDFVSIDKDFLLSVCNDSTRAVHSDIEDQVIKLWVNDQGWVA